MAYVVRIVVWFAAAAFVACAQASSWAEDEAAIGACFMAMDREPALGVVNAKFARRDPSAEQLADTSVASADEADALRLRAQLTRPCRELRLAAVERHHPPLKPAYVALYYQADQVFAYLQAGVITYGAANALAAEALELFQARAKVYFAADTEERAALGEIWDEQLQQAHSNPPPDALSACAWEDLNLACA